VAALSCKNVLFVNPVTMSGNEITGDKLGAVENEFDKLRDLCHQSGKTVFK